MGIVWFFIVTDLHMELIMRQIREGYEDAFFTFFSVSKIFSNTLNFLLI